MSPKRHMEEIKLRMPWGHIAGKAWGSPQSTRVLVVHGVMDNAGSFDRIMPMLPENFYYVVPDLPGHGLSSPMPLGVQLDYMNYVLAIRLILDQLKWDDCVYLGHSLGSQLGMFTSILNPGRISRLVCIDGFIPQPSDRRLLRGMRATQDTAVQALSALSPPLHTRDEILYALKNKRQFPLNSAAAEALFPRATTKVGDLYKYNRDFRLRTNMTPLLNVSQLMDLITHVKIPVFIIMAGASWLRGDHAKEFEGVFGCIPPNFTIITVPGNHDVHNNDPEVVAPHVSAFLNDAGKSKL